MTKIEVKRNSLEHQAIQALDLFEQIGRGESATMRGIKGVSKLPRWDRNSWNGYQFETFTIFLSDEAIKQVEAYCKRYALTKEKKGKE